MVVRRRSRWPVGMVAAALALLVLGGCAPGAAPEDQPDEDAAADEPAADVNAGESEEIVLRVLDARAGEPGVQATYERIDQAFEERNPGVVVDRESIAFDELTTTINLRLSGDDAPDVAAVNMGHGTLGPLVRAELVRPLDDYADEYGWWDRQSDVLLAMDGRHTEDGAVMGEGPLFAVSDTGAPVGIYYNVQHLTDLGHEVPETWDEFEAATQSAQAVDMTPVMFGNVDAWPGIHLAQLFLNDRVGRQGVADFVYGLAPLEGEEPVTAAAEARQWVEQGVFPDGWEGLDYESVWQRFGEGEGLFLPSGSWLAGDLAAMNDDVRFILMPPSDGAPYQATASGDFPWSIPTNAQHPDVAAEYIDFRLSDEVARMYIEDAHIPASLPADWDDLVEPETLQHDMLAAWAQLNADDGMVPYMDWATPEFYEVVTSEIQMLLAGRRDPDAFVNALNEGWSAFHD